MVYQSRIICLKYGGIHTKEKGEGMTTLSEDVLSKLERMSALATSFPSLKGIDRDYAGIDPWNPDKLDNWACGPMSTTRTQHIARFLLSIVWNHYLAWRCGYFDLHASTRDLDKEDRKVIADWLLNPWFP